MALPAMVSLRPTAAPFHATHAQRHRVLRDREERIPKLVGSDLPVVMRQRLRALIYSQFELGMRGYETSHPDTELRRRRGALSAALARHGLAHNDARPTLAGRRSPTASRAAQALQRLDEVLGARRR